jgi:hypothetical protein
MSILAFVFAVSFALVLLFVVVAAARRGTSARGTNTDTGDTSWIATSTLLSDSGSNADCSSSDGGGGCDGGGGGGD